MWHVEGAHTHTHAQKKKNERKERKSVRQAGV